MTALFAVFLAAALAAGCLFDGDDEERDRALLQRMRADIESFVGVPACAESSACAFVAFGAKPCGGPWRYLVYSKASVDSSALAQKVEAYNQFEDSCNRKYGWMSDCSTPSTPRLSCEKGICVDLNVQP
jgi:hypothetical protein